jgi:hypothetical protein
MWEGLYVPTDRSRDQVAPAGVNQPRLGYDSGESSPAQGRPGSKSIRTRRARFSGGFGFSVLRSCTA